MAKKAVNKKQKSVEATIWEYAENLRNHMEPSEYKKVVLYLIFLKFINEKFNEQREKLILNGESDFVEEPMFYEQDNVVFIPEEARWDYLMQNAKQVDIALKLDKAFHLIENENACLVSALPVNYYSSLKLGKGVLGNLLDVFNGLGIEYSKDVDVFGKVFEYCLKRFAISEGKGKGEFYTTRSLVQVLCECVEPYEGIIYDGACGSGGMFVHAVNFIEKNGGNKLAISAYGQESNDVTRKLAIMNLVIRGIPVNIGEAAESTFTNDLHPDLDVDYFLMNPSFNQKRYRGADQLLDDPAWDGYSVPPVSNANYAWILKALSKSKKKDTCGGMLLANGALNSGEKGNPEYEIRKQLIINDYVEAIFVMPRNMFYNTDISVTIWIFNKNKKAKSVNKNGVARNLRDRSNEILFVDYRNKGHLGEEGYVEFSEEEIKELAAIYHNWQSIDKDTLYKDIPELCCSASIKDIEKQDYSLIPSKYIKFIDKDLDIDYKTEMSRIQKEMKNVIDSEKSSQKTLIEAFRGIGYGIEKL